MFSWVIQSSQEKMKIGGRGVGEEGGGGDKVYFRQCESCETTVKRQAAIKHCQSLANVVVIFIDSIDGKLSRDNPR